MHPTKYLCYRNPDQQSHLHLNWAQTKNTPHTTRQTAWSLLAFFFRARGGVVDEVNNTYLAVLVTPDLLVGGSLAPGFKSPDPWRNGEEKACSELPFVCPKGWQKLYIYTRFV